MMSVQQVPGSRDGVPHAELSPDQVPDPGQRPPLVLPSLRPPTRHPAPGPAPPADPHPADTGSPALRGQAGRATGLPGLPPPLHRPLRYPQLSSDVRNRDTLLEPLHGRQPDQFPPPAALDG